MNKGSPSRLEQLKIRHLQFLIRLVKLENLGRTAEEMSMTQSAASRLLTEMEQRFGQPLFDRGRHGMRLLPSAKHVLRFAKMVCIEEQIVRDALSLDGERPARLRIGTLHSVPSIVIKAVQDYKLLKPTGDVLLRQGTMDLLLPLLLSGELDVTVGRYDALRSQPPLIYERLAEEPMKVVAGNCHPLVGKERISPEELRSHPWIAPVRSSSLYPHFAELFGGLPLPESIIECASPTATRIILQDNRHLGIMASSMLAQPVGKDLCAMDVSFNSPGPLGMYRVRDRLVPKEVEMFCEFLRDAAEDQHYPVSSG